MGGGLRATKNTREHQESPRNRSVAGLWRCEELGCALISGNMFVHTVARCGDGDAKLGSFCRVWLSQEGAAVCAADVGGFAYVKALPEDAPKDRLIGATVWFVEGTRMHNGVEKPCAEAVQIVELGPVSMDTPTGKGKGGKQKVPPVATKVEVKGHGCGKGSVRAQVDVKAEEGTEGDDGKKSAKDPNDICIRASAIFPLLILSTKSMQPRSKNESMGPSTA